MFLILSNHYSFFFFQPNQHLNGSEWEFQEQGPGKLHFLLRAEKRQESGVLGGWVDTFRIWVSLAIW